MTKKPKRKKHAQVWIDAKIHAAIAKRAAEEKRTHGAIVERLWEEAEAKRRAAK